MRPLLRFTLIATLFAIAPHSIAEEITSPGELVEKVKQFYESNDTYRSEGTVDSEFDMQGQKMSVETRYSILLKKPNLYLITWEQKGMPMPGMSQAGAVWSDGTQPFLFMGMMNAYSKMESDEMALGAATGISSGVAMNVPSLFLTVFENQGSPLIRIENPQFEESEKVGDEDCYVLSGSSMASKREAVWISKSDFSIRKFYQSLEAPEGGRQIPEMSDEELEQTLESMGRPVTDESKQELKAMMEESRAAFSEIDMKGHIIETHEKIATPDVEKADFEFEVPQGAELRDSLFDGANHFVPAP